MVIKLSDFFLKENSRMYDLGSSTGVLLNKIEKKINQKN